MNIVVCIKQVPDTEAKIQISSDQTHISTDSIKWILNPYDEFAVTEALKIKQELGAQKVIAITVGQDRAKEALRRTLAMGVDEAHHIVTTGDPDLSSTLSALTAEIKNIGDVQVVLTGKIAIDTQQGVLAPMLASKLGWQCISNLTSLEIKDSHFHCTQEGDASVQNKLKASAPLVLSANKGLNNPKAPNLPSIMKAKKKPLNQKNFSELGIEFSPLKFIEIKPPKLKPPVQMLEGDINSQAKKLVELLRNESKVI